MPHAQADAAATAVLYVPLPEGSPLQAELRLSGPPMTVADIRQLRESLTSLLDDLAEVQQALCCA